ncbi:MAG: hypothetical protein Q8T09_19625 [Candidatus Melainabacteria bacterium]|nr:hypothetical protein [Candidatus Melainabacteria bacterium]
MKITLRQLTELCKDPAAFAARLSQEKQGFGKTRYNYLRFAIDKVHRGVSFQDAEKYLEDSMLNNFKTQKGNDVYIEQFRAYIRNTQELNSTVVKVRDPIEIPIKQNLKPLYTVSGQLARLDMLEHGYGLWFLSTKTEDWTSDWRLPIVTAAYQKNMQVDADELTVGVYDFDAGEYSQFQFEQAQLDDALEKLNSSLDALLKMGVK